MSGPKTRHMTPTAAASVGARRRRPSPPTDGSHGRAVSKNLGRCAPAGCSATSGRSPETPGSLPSTPGPEGERQWSAASATLRSAPRPHRLRRASMARRSTAACSECSRHSGQPRQALWEGLQGQGGPYRAQRRAQSTTPTSSPVGSPAAGLRGAPLDGRLLPTLPTASSASLLSLRPPPGACADRLASPALPTPTTRASARRPRRLRRARVARCSSGACSAGCAAQPDSLRAPLIRRGAAGGDAAAQLRCERHHRVLGGWTVPQG